MRDASPCRAAVVAKSALEFLIHYSDYARGYLGRFDPATGQTREWPSPGGPKSLPYGITVIHDILWYNESGTKPNMIVRFDPKTEQFQA